MLLRQVCLCLVLHEEPPTGTFFAIHEPPRVTCFVYPGNYYVIRGPEPFILDLGERMRRDIHFRYLIKAHGVCIPEQEHVLMQALRRCS